MKKRNGFTLVELLAVIVILAIIALISTPIIINVIEKARKGAFEDSTYGVLEAGKIYFTTSIADANKFTGETFDFSNDVSRLKLAGEKPAGGFLLVDPSGKQALAVWNKDKSWCASKGFNEEKIKIAEYNEEDCNLPISAKEYILSKGTVTSGDGLYEDRTSESGYVYKGLNPNNLAIYDEKCFSIMRLEGSGQIKLIYEGKASNNKCSRSTSTGTIGRYPWNPTTSNSFIQPSNMKNVVDNLSEGKTVGSLTFKNLDSIVNYDWYIGAVKRNVGQNIEVDMTQQKTLKSEDSGWPDNTPYVYTSKVGLIYATDFVKASTNSTCASVYDADDKTDGTNYNCAVSNYLIKNYSWYIQTVQTYSKNVIVATESLNLGRILIGTIEVRPVIYLSENVKAKGNGTLSEPYIFQ